MRSTVVYCGVDPVLCTGNQTTVSVGIGAQIKTHPTHEEAFACRCRSLVAQGYTRIGTREFSKPGEPVLVVTRPGRYGARLRPGKEARNMASMRTGGFVVSM